MRRLKGVAERQGVARALLAVAWVLANLIVDVAIVEARDSQQIEQTAPAADIQLTPKTLAEIEQIMRDAAPIGGPSPEGM